MNTPRPVLSAGSTFTLTAQDGERIGLSLVEEFAHGASASTWIVGMTSDGREQAGLYAARFTVHPNSYPSQSERIRTPHIRNLEALRESIDALQSIPKQLGAVETLAFGVGNDARNQQCVGQVMPLCPFTLGGLRAGAGQQVTFSGRSAASAQAADRHWVTNVPPDGYGLAAIPLMLEPAKTLRRLYSRTDGPAVFVRDFGANNLLVDPSGRLRIADLGSATLAEQSRTFAGESLGITPDYAPLEFWRALLEDSEPYRVSAETEAHQFGQLLFTVATFSSLFPQTAQSHGAANFRHMCEAMEAAFTDTWVVPPTLQDGGPHGNLQPLRELLAILCAPEGKQRDFQTAVRFMEDFVAVEGGPAAITVTYTGTGRRSGKVGPYKGARQLEALEAALSESEVSTREAVVSEIDDLLKQVRDQRRDEKSSEQPSIDRLQALATQRAIELLAESPGVRAASQDRDDELTVRNRASVLAAQAIEAGRRQRLGVPPASKTATPKVDVAGVKGSSHASSGDRATGGRSHKVVASLAIGALGVIALAVFAGNFAFLPDQNPVRLAALKSNVVAPLASELVGFAPPGNPEVVGTLTLDGMDTTTTPGGNAVYAVDVGSTALNRQVQASLARPEEWSDSRGPALIWCGPFETYEAPNGTAFSVPIPTKEGWCHLIPAAPPGVSPAPRTDALNVGRPALVGPTSSGSATTSWPVNVALGEVLPSDDGWLAFWLPISAASFNKFVAGSQTWPSSVNYRVIWYLDSEHCLLSSEYSAGTWGQYSAGEDGT